MLGRPYRCDKRPPSEEVLLRSRVVASGPGTKPTLESNGGMSAFRGEADRTSAVRAQTPATDDQTSASCA